MSKSDAYYQFPIAILKNAECLKQLVNDACYYSLFLYAEKLVSNDDLKIDGFSDGLNIEVLRDQYLVDHPNPPDYDPDDKNHNVVLAAASWLHVKIPGIDTAIKVMIALRNEYGTKGRQVRIRTDYAWSAHDDDWPLLKLKVLCGVLGGIGSSGIARLNHRMIQALAAGYNSPKGLTDSDLLRKSSVRYWLKQLWQNNFFQHCMRGRECWYSINQPDDLSLAVAVKTRLSLRVKKTKIDANDI